MKKFFALLLALALVVTGIVSAMAYPTKQWINIDLNGYKVVYLFDYNETIAIDVDGKTAAEAEQAFNWNLAKKETYPQSGGKNPYTDVRYVVSGTYAAGFEANEVVGNGSALNVVPVDLTVTENTAFVYPIVTNSHVVIGLLFAKVNVDEGFVQVEGQYKDEIYANFASTLTVYTAKSQVADGGANFEFGTPISIEEELGGAPAILLSTSGKVTYPTLFGNMKSGKTLAYQDYYRNENWVRTYRTTMIPALYLVAD